MFINEDIRNKFSKLNLNVEDGEILKLKDVKRNYHILAKGNIPISTRTKMRTHESFLRKSFRNC